MLKIVNFVLGLYFKYFSVVLQHCIFNYRFLLEEINSKGVRSFDTATTETFVTSTKIIRNMLKSIVVSLTKPSGVKALTGFLSSSRAYCAPPKAEGKRSSTATTTNLKIEFAEPKAEEPPQPVSNIKSEKTGSITLIGINRAEVRNAINTETAIQLSEAIEKFESDPESPVAVLYGIGGNFCAGYDLKELSNNKDAVASLILRSEGAMVSRCWISNLEFRFILQHFRVQLAESLKNL